MKLKYYDKKADTLYIRFNEVEYSYTEELDELRSIDYDTTGNPIGVELFGVSKGVLTDDLPERSKIEKLLGDRGIKIYA